MADIENFHPVPVDLVVDDAAAAGKANEQYPVLGVQIGPHPSRFGKPGEVLVSCIIVAMALATAGGLFSNRERLETLKVAEGCRRPGDDRQVRLGHWRAFASGRPGHPFLNLLPR